MSLLLKPYPIDTSLKRHIFLAAALTFWALLFLWLSEPISIQDLSISSKLKLVPVSAAVSGVCFSLTLIYQNAIIKKSGKWKLLNELIFLIIGLGLSFICLYSIYIFTLNLGDKTYNPFQYFYLIFLPVYVMVLPAIIVGRFSLHRFFAKKSEKKEEESLLVIKGQGKSDFISLPEKDLLYLKAADNYVEVTFLQNGNPSTHVLRTKLSIIEKNIPKLIRTHRSYIINEQHFRRFKTTKTGTSAIMSNGDEIPVSKSYKSESIRRLTSTTN